MTNSLSANPKAKKMVQKLVQNFSEIDADGDGFISMEELSGMMPEEKVKKFQKELKAIDKNNDSKLSKEELSAITK
jgi:Ca2+-binding EF-hand superfamily protein